MTFVAGAVVRSLNFVSFADITAAAVSFPGGGVEFAATLTPAQVDAVWWRITSRDAADEAARRNLATLLAANDPGLCAALVRYVLGTEAP